MRPDDELRIRYFEDPAFRALADKIHHSRLMAGAACLQCMEIAANRLKAQASKCSSVNCPDLPPDP